MPPHEGEQNGVGSPERALPGQSYGTYDEVSMQHSHNFLMALQELKNLRPQLYSAAEYCEQSYLYSNQKQVVLENLKDYSVKALVNAVDHLGTVAFKLNDLLSQQANEVASADIRAGSLAQRLRSCQEHSDREGLKQQSLAKSTQANHKHYVLPDVTEFSKRPYDQDVVAMSRETFDLEQVQSQAQAPDGSGSSRNLAWHFAVDRSPAKTGSSSTLHQPSSSRYLSSPLRDVDGSVSRDSDSSNTSSGPLIVSEKSKYNSRSRSAERVRREDGSRSGEKSSDKSKSLRIPGRSQSTERRPLAKVSTSNVQAASLARSVSQLNTTDPDRDSRPPSRSKSLLRSLLSRGRNGRADLRSPALTTKSGEAGVGEAAISAPIVLVAYGGQEHNISHVQLHIATEFVKHLGWSYNPSGLNVHPKVRTDVGDTSKVGVIATLQVNCASGVSCLI